jgi:hypothetical protein
MGANLTTTPIDWLGMELWTLRESAYLLSGEAPPFDESGFAQERDSGSRVAVAYRRLKDATRTGSLAFIMADSADTLMRRRVRPADVAAWARNNALVVPAAFAALCDQDAPSGRTGSLIVQVDGRAAIPVRALPYVAGWDNAPPDSIAKQLAHAVHEAFRWLPDPSYVLAAGRSRPLLPREWDAHVAELEGLEAELKLRHGDGLGERVGYRAWMKEAVALLPSGAFLWLDEFEHHFLRRFDPESTTIVGERKGDRDLIYSPSLSEDVRSMVLEGFSAPHAERAAAGRYTLDEAARALEAAGERYELMRAKLMKDAASHVLPVYEPGRNARLRYGYGPGETRATRDFYEEARWDELNDWLASYEPRITFRFSPPAVADNHAQDKACVDKPAHDQVQVANSPSEEAPAWWSSVLPYVVGKLKAGQHATMKELFHALHQAAGTEDSPFSRGEGAHRGKLVVREFRQPVALKTMQGRWAEVRKAANIR